jgi:HD-GYP domain-containing protein (c-di-GMP phosphodiesterase class II)
MAVRLKLTSFENASLLRKLSIFYFVISIVPFGFLYYLYLQLQSTGRIELDIKDFTNALIFVGIGIFVGYFAMRAMVAKLTDITRRNTETLEQILGVEKIRAISSGNSNEISILTKSFNEITSRLEENIRNLELAKKTLHSVLSRVGEGISSMDNIDTFLHLIVETMTESLQSENGVLFLLDESRGEFYLKFSYGPAIAPNTQICIPRQAALITPLLQSKKAELLTKIAADVNPGGVFRAPVICAPMVLHDHVLGFMAVWHRSNDEAYHEEELNLFNNLALQTAVAIENSRLNEDAEKTYFETISALALAVEAKDPYSRGHSERVARFSVALGKHFNLSPVEINLLRDAAKLHDLGKIGVTDAVLKKDGPLTTDEMEMMKRHSEIGEGIIKPIRSLKNLCDPIRHHHEKLDGTGYPDRIKGNEISFLTRILTVADIYDALTSERSYRPSFTSQKAFDELRKMKDQVDQRVVDALAAIISNPQV